MGRPLARRDRDERRPGRRRLPLDHRRSTDAIARKFYASVCGYKVEIVGELLVYDGGQWVGSSNLFQQIGDTTFDNLILPEKLKKDVQADVERFFASREAYEKYKIPWKRGLLFVGPPGNGKTHAIKALINATGRPCLYIKSFDSDCWVEETGIRRVFERARAASPCLLVLEDLDSLVTEENRSFFLNEMDGFASNVGILTIATTNHPAKLDPAILDRPSRFDRKYHFGLPARPERLAYIARWNQTLEPEARLTGPKEKFKPPTATEGFSFAYLERAVPLLADGLGRRARIPDDGRDPGGASRDAPGADEDEGGAREDRRLPTKEGGGGMLDWVPRSFVDEGERMQWSR